MSQRYDDPRRTGRDEQGQPDRSCGGEDYRNGARGRYAVSRYGQSRSGGGQGQSGCSRYGEKPRTEEEHGRYGEPSRTAPRDSAPRAESGAVPETATTPRGPQGYPRSDQRIEDDVRERVARRAGLDSSEMTVDAKNATVMLEGTVPELWMKEAIEDIADHCPGVKDVQNRVRVESPGTRAH